MEKTLLKMDDLGGKPTIFGNIHIATLQFPYILEAQLHPSVSWQLHHLRRGCKVSNTSFHLKRVTFAKQPRFTRKQRGPFNGWS